MNRRLILRNAVEVLQAIIRAGGWFKWAYPQELPEGTFGKLYYYRCDHKKCGAQFDKEPELVCTYGGCGWGSPTGPEPAEYEQECPECGRQGWIYEREGTDWYQDFTATRRYIITIRRRKAA